MTYRRATPAENLRILAARLSDHLSPAEKRELAEAASLLSLVAPEEAAIPAGAPIMDVNWNEDVGLTIIFLADAVWNYRDGEWHKIEQTADASLPQKDEPK